MTRYWFINIPPWHLSMRNAVDSRSVLAGGAVVTLCANSTKLCFLCRGGRVPVAPAHHMAAWLGALTNNKMLQVHGMPNCLRASMTL